ncbi:hypothetical protein [Sphingobium sp. CCH11-B1]|uniref:hypothetical protein n=1 Tax=Sphingobium sp. CCH11-B1 TaxID=1768781 RepID=UPI000830F87B|nr:hypothetical protein [Sphingobium sp. CCH11-B1]MEA3387918.1 hypothetical protein [Pseudomonadota bacterium]
MHFRAAALLAANLCLASAAHAATPTEVVARHVESMKVGKLQPIMDDYSADTVVVTPEGLVAGQTPAKGPGVYSGQARASRVFATLTDKDHHAGIKAMETRIEPVGPDSVILHWVQNKGQPSQVSGKDVFIVRNDKIEFQTIMVD